MNNIDCGPGRATFEIANDGIVRAGFGGVVMIANAGALSGLLLEAGAAKGAVGVLCSVEKSLVALAPITPKHFNYVSHSLRHVPVAVVVTPEQLSVYEDVAESAALSGAMRRAFLSTEEAQAWLRDQVYSLNANRAWWSARRSPR
jgi:hypothetical protein